MLTPDEIRSREFLISLRGYDPDDVRHFLDEVASQLEEAERFAFGSSRVPAAAETSRAMQRILEVAEETAQDIVAAAETRAKQIEAEARQRAEQLLGDASSAHSSRRLRGRTHE